MNLSSLAREPSVAQGAARRTIPFDYQFHLSVFDEKDPTKSMINHLLTSTVTVSVEAAFVAVSVGYGFLPQVSKVAFGGDVLKAIPPASLTFGEIIDSLSKRLGEAQPIFESLSELAVTHTVAPPLDVGPLTERALLSGFQINPAVAQHFLQILQDGGTMQPAELAELFQTADPPPDRVQFLYELYDKGTGRAFQSEPLLNIAGLGISDGDRPFRYFATPIVFPPRSTIQLNVIPKTDFRGELYVSLHGYKVLGGVGTPTGHKLRPSVQGRRHRRP